jgi:hypothetical protein
MALAYERLAEKYAKRLTRNRPLSSFNFSRPGEADQQEQEDDSQECNAPIS